LDRYRTFLRGAQRSALFLGSFALVWAGLTAGSTRPALAEFEIQESGVEKGEVELEYRGAVHDGFPKAEREEAEEEEGGALEEEEEGEFLRQSHDFEFEYGLTNRLLFSTTLGTDEPLEDDFDLSSVELELLYELVDLNANGVRFGLAFIGGYGFATRSGEADELEFGPIMELGSGGFLLTTNTFFSSQVGDNRETDGLGFEYGWRAQQRIAKKWAIAAEMFGEIEDLSNAGSFDDQPHSLGPTLLYIPGEDDDEGGGNGEDDEDRVAEGPEMEISLNVGVQFGLTDATSDTAVKFQGALGF
jgi:hypothetical protein